MLKVLSAVTALIGASALAILPAKAQEWPTKQPVKLVISSPSGGLTDALARVTAEFLGKRIGQAVVVEAKPGASGTIGAAYVANAPADGYTIFLAGAEQAISPAVRPNLAYKFEDFTFLVRPFTAQPLVLAGPNFQPKNTKEVIEYMKSNPGKLRYGTTGVGAIVHMGTVMLQNSAGVQGVHVPYAGIAPIYTDLLAGSVDVTFGGTFPFPEGLKVLGTVGTKRSPVFPDAPTLEESGVNGASWDVWFGFLAPPGLPQDIADRLNAELLAVVRDPEAIAKYKEVTKAAPEENPLVGPEFKAMALKSVQDWTTVAKAANIVIEE